MTKTLKERAICSGGWGRNRVYDSEIGNDLIVAGGRWIQVFGGFGIIGFIARFSLIVITVYRAKKAAKLLQSTSEKILLSSHAILMGLLMIDQLPNSSLAPWLWLLVAMLLGRSEKILVDNKVGFNKDRNVQ